MAQNKLRLMISSRCKIKFPINDETGVELSEIRRQIKKEVEAETFLGKPLVNVWINEEETDAGSETLWDSCIRQAASCDMFISLLDGEAGWQTDNSGIGICHAEFEEAYSTSPGKVRVISLIGDIAQSKPHSRADSEFLKAVNRASILEARRFKSVVDLKQRTKEMVRELVLQLAHEGAREVKQSGSNTGQALDWSRLNFEDRQRGMIDVLISSLSTKKGAKSLEGSVVVPISDVPVLFWPSAIPAAFSVSSAREMVGQPFLRDHELSDSLKGKQGGPVHVIACHKNVTEAQAMSLLGFPDATIVSGSFGVYVADNIQKIQLCLISNCRDVASTRHGLQKLFDWLERTGEDELLARRATSRAKILKTITGELE